MSTRVASKKRKSVDGNDIAVKKTKLSKSAEQPTPAKSALKKAKKVDASTTASQVKAKAKKAKTTPTTSDPAVEKSGAATVRTKTKTKTPKKAVVADDDDAPDLTEDQTAALLAGFSSSDEDDNDNEDEGIALSKLPLAPTTGEVQKRIQDAIAEQDDPETTPGVIYLGRVPHGFYERQMRAYLAQFGEITRLRLARNKKTGKSKHYAFVEFASAAVADIVVKTMDKYLLFGHLLQVRRVPQEQVVENIFLGPKSHPPPRNKMERRLLKDGKVREDWDKKVTKENKRRAEKAAQLKEMGYDFDMPEVKPVDSVPVKPKEIEAVGGQTSEATELDAAPEAAQSAEVELAEKASKKKRAAEAKPKAKKVVKKAKV